MASIQARVSRGKKYWSIVESKRINGKPRTIILEYLGTIETLQKRLSENIPVSVKSYSHGDTTALLNAAAELDVLNIINKHIPEGKHHKQQKRDGMSVGGSLLLAAIGRACHPTSKKGWYDWCKETSLEYLLKRTFKKLDSNHFWDQMDALPVEAIQAIEDELVAKLIEKHKIELDCLLFDTTNFFTFIDSTNENCSLPKRGKNKQRRYDLRQVGMALLVSRKEQFPLFHHTYQGNKNDVTVFKEVFGDLVGRLKKVTNELSDITLIFDKGNNSKANFSMLDEEEDFHYVAGLVSSHFKPLIQEANKNFTPISINDEELPVYRTKYDVWGKERTCVVCVSERLKEGQIRGIHQHLDKKHKTLERFKKQLENPKARKSFTQEEIEERLNNTIKGQFVDKILKYEIISTEEGKLSFTYYIDLVEFTTLKEEVLGRQIMVTNRHDWSNEEIILAYRGQSKVEYAFRNLKNPYHLAVRPQYHWTDQKIKVHFFICVVGYLLAIAVYTRAQEKAGYKKDMSKMMDELKTIRLACMAQKNNKIKYQMETLSPALQELATALNISDDRKISKLIKFQ